MPGLGPGAHPQVSREPWKGLEPGSAKIQRVFTFTLERNPVLYEGVCVWGFSWNRAVRGERSRSQVLRGILESSGGTVDKATAEVSCWVTFPAASTEDLGCRTGTRTHGTTLWAKLAEDLDFGSGPDGGKMEGMCASSSLAAGRCDLMTSDPRPTLRLAKLSHGR